MGAWGRAPGVRRLPMKSFENSNNRRNRGANVFFDTKGEKMKLAIIGITALVALSGAGQAAAADGKAVYDKSCSACHNNMPP
jgi:cytochrome c5